MRKSDYITSKSLHLREYIAYRYLLGRRLSFGKFYISSNLTKYDLFLKLRLYFMKKRHLELSQL